jgi:hypothetical protein
MDINLHEKAINLLEKIANSVYERDPHNPHLMCFSITEVNLVEQWLTNFIKEVKHD